MFLDTQRVERCTILKISSMQLEIILILLTKRQFDVGLIQSQHTYSEGTCYSAPKGTLKSATDTSISVPVQYNGAVVLFGRANQLSTGSVYGVDICIK